jgi:hypothetical protein
VYGRKGGALDEGCRWTTERGGAEIRAGCAVCDETGQVGQYNLIILDEGYYTMWFESYKFLCLLRLSTVSD